jgi:hypothetical protein
MVPCGFTRILINSDHSPTAVCPKTTDAHLTFAEAALVGADTASDPSVRIGDLSRQVPFPACPLMGLTGPSQGCLVPIPDTGPAAAEDGADGNVLLSAERATGHKARIQNTEARIQKPEARRKERLMG